MVVNPVSLITGIFDEGAGGTRAPFELRAGRFVQYELEVVSFSGHERVNDVYRYEVTFATEMSSDAIHALIFGAPACLTVKSPGNSPQVIQGLVSSLEGLGGVAGEQATKRRRYRLEIVPRLWLMKRSRKNRVFQGKTVMQIVDALLAEVGMSPSESRWRTVKSEYPVLPFIYQRNESNFDFFRRILASAGIFFYFEHANGLLDALLPGAGAGLSAATGVASSLGGVAATAAAGAGAAAAATGSVTVLNFARRATDTPAVSPGGLSAGVSIGVTPSVGADGIGVSADAADEAPSATLEYDDGMGADDDEERIYAFGLKKRLRSKALQLLEREVAQATNWIGSDSTGAVTIDPKVKLSAGSGGVSASASLGFDVDAPLLKEALLREERYQVDPTLTLATNKLVVDHQNSRELDRTRRRYLEARGKTDCRRMGAGYRFKLAGHPIDALNDEYTVTALDAEGTHPNFSKDGEPVYTSRFRCIPADSMPIPPRPSKRPKLGLEVAQVVAYSGIAQVPGLETSPAGYVKIRFRWDIVDTKGTPAGGLQIGTDDDAAIWVPVMQPWAGAGYGAQFVPREGMEVLVGFLEHQGERPVVLGCLYGDQSPPPWPAKTDMQKVGIRSKTRPANGGYSEISLDDQQGKEVVTLRAQKDVDESAVNDWTTTVGNDDSLTVAHDRSVDIGNDDSELVKGSASRTVHGTDTVSIAGDSTVAIAGDSTTTVAGDVTQSTAGKTTETFGGDLSVTIGGALATSVAGETQQTYADDYTERHLGHRTIIVGTGDAHRTAALHVEGMGRAYGSMTFEIEVLQSLTLICGSSQVLLSPTGITLNSPNISLVGTAVDVQAKTFTVTTSDALTLAGKTVTMETSGAEIALDSSSVALSSTQIKLGSGSGSVSQATADPVKITKVQMKDAQGKPRANARVLLLKGGKGGEQRMTVLDADGMLELIGDTQYQIVFPDDPVAK